MMLDALSAFLDAATPAQRDALAIAADTTLAQLNHLKRGRDASAGLAARIERAAALIRRGCAALPKLDRRDIAAVCHECPLAA